MEDFKNKISFIKEVEITDGKTDITYSALSSKVAKYGEVESLGRFGSDGMSVIIEHKKLSQH